ncbi:hypothetical protein DPEC_G00182520 [Dallia pectoralis]|uniref:Uncharacterized protein n=1 Tax=Dallia pectoralis TaxID=75939 RepID=A0ACC2GAR0_DALPE|nr:hypothetical protein DPEC_G00182520 [Dallia pectoralis]
MFNYTLKQRHGESYCLAGTAVLRKRRDTRKQEVDGEPAIVRNEESRTSNGGEDGGRHEPVRKPGGDKTMQELEAELDKSRV